jgi:lipoprotein-releasing system permease protein
MLAGSLDALRSGEYGVVLGKVLAHVLNASVGDEVDLLVPQSTVTPAGVFPRTRRFRVVGIFEVGMFEYDRTQAMIHLEDAQRLNRMEGGVTGLRLKLADLFAAPQIAQQLNDDLPAGYYVTDWTRQHANFFRAIRTEKTVMFVILALVVAVAAFNIVSTLVMMVADKRGDIAILRTLGASPVSVMMIFMVQGVLIGVVGTIVGVSLGVLLALNVETLVPWIEQFSGVNFVPSDVYQISTVPSKLEISDVTRVSLMSLMLSFVSTLYPAWRASRTDPAEALRYE